MARSGGFFDGFAADFDSLYDGRRSLPMRWFDRTFRSDMFLRFDRTFEYLGDLRGRSVLDVGCGSGPYVAEALRRGAAAVTAIDPAPAMLALAQKRVQALGRAGDVTLMTGYFPEVRPSARHDAAIVMGVLDYVLDPVPFLRALLESVERGASVSFPSWHWLRGPVRALRYRARNVDLRLYRQAEVEAVCRAAGARKCSVHAIPGAGMDFVVWIEP